MLRMGIPEPDVFCLLLFDGDLIISINMLMNAQY